MEQKSEMELDFKYLDRFKEAIKDCPTILQPIFQKTIRMLDPLVLTLGRTIDEEKIIKDALEIHSKVKAGWLCNEEVGFQINSYIKNFNQFFYFSREEVNALLDTNSELVDVIVELQEKIKTLEMQKDKEEKTKEAYKQRSEVLDDKENL